MNSLSLNSNVYSPNKIYSDQIKQIKKLICAGIKTVFTVVCFLLLLNWNVNYSLSQRVPCILLCLIKLNNIFTSNLPVFLVFSFCRGGWCYSLCCCTSGNWGRDPTGNKMSFFWLPSAVVVRCGMGIRSWFSCGQRWAGCPIHSRSASCYDYLNSVFKINPVGLQLD